MPMRNRTELVTTTVEGSDNEESGGEDSGEDWQPEKTSGSGRKSGGRKSVTKTPNKRKSTTRASVSAKKGKKAAESEPEEEEDDDEENENSDDEENEDEEGGEEDSEEVARRKRRQISGKNHPDKDGFMELYLFKNDLDKNYRNDDKLCLWRRDGASLLQKYLVDLKDDAAAGSMIFKGSSVYSCWEEKRKSDFFTIKVKVVGDKRDSKVRVEDAAELEKFAMEDRPPVDTTPNGADPTIESIQSTDDEDDEDEDEDGEMDSEGEMEDDEE